MRKHLPRSHEDRSTWMKQLCVSMDTETLQQISLAAKAAHQTRSAWVHGEYSKPGQCSCL